MGAGREGCRAVEGRASGAVPGRVLGGVKGGPEVGEEQSVYGSTLGFTRYRPGGRAVPGFGAVLESKGPRPDRSLP